MTLPRRAFIGAAAALFPAAKTAAAKAAAETAPPFQPWSAQGVIDARNEGKRVFVAFRADWCVICKINEMTVLKTQKVRETLSQSDVAYFIADYTAKDDPAIRKQLDQDRKSVV